MDFHKREVRYKLRCTAASLAFMILVFISLWAAVKDVSITVQIAQFPYFLDPARISTYEEKLIGGALYETLLSYDPESGTAKGVLAEKCQVDDNGKVYTFTLRKDARFHNGEPVHAEDVKFSWERLLDSEISNYGYLLDNILGAESVLKGECSNADGIQVIDDLTLRVILEEPDYTFPALVSSPVLGVICQDFVRKQGGESYGKLGTEINGTGPFSLNSWHNNRIVLVKKRNHRKTPHLNKLEFVATNNQQEIKHLFIDGKVDILAGVTPQFVNFYSQGDGQSRANLIKKPVLSLYYLGFNLSQEPFGDQVELRRGINSMLDKENLAELLLGEGGNALYGFLPPELIVDDEADDDKVSEYSFDKNKALKLLASAGYPYGSKLSPLTLAYNESPGHERVVRLVQENLGKIGVRIIPKKWPWEEYQEELRSGQYPFFRLGWDADYPEPGNLLFCNFNSKSQDNNFTGYNSQKLDSLLRKARAEQDFKERQEIYRQAEELIISDLPVIPLFQRVALFVLQKDIKGFQVDLLGMVDFTSLDKLK